MNKVEKVLLAIGCTSGILGILGITICIAKGAKR